MSLFRRTAAPRSGITLTPENSTPKNLVTHGPGCPCQDDRSAGRWCNTCGTHGSHHTDRHDTFHDNPWPERRHVVEFAPFECAKPCGQVHEAYNVLTYAISKAEAMGKATARLLNPIRGHQPINKPVALHASLDL